MTQPRASARRDEITRAAAAEFDEVGYAAASLSSIAARLGKTKGAMSYHFSSKGLLAREVVETQYRQWEDVLTGIRRDGHAGLDAIIVLAFAVARRFRDDVLVRAGMRLQYDVGTRGVELPTPYVSWMEMTHALLAEAQGRGELVASVDLDMATEVLVEAFVGLQQVAQRLTQAQDILQRVEHYWMLLLAGLGVPDASQRLTRLAELAEAY
jgi:AcrR family transcriptional regulator